MAYKYTPLKATIGVNTYNSLAEALNDLSNYSIDETKNTEFLTLEDFTQLENTNQYDYILTKTSSKKIYYILKIEDAGKCVLSWIGGDSVKKGCIDPDLVDPEWLVIPKELSAIPKD
ncbi:hypothetical protein GGH92_001890, partial [Coemansia sp. RSA 2673]